jgi:hypothetical protein
MSRIVQQSFSVTDFCLFFFEIPKLSSTSFLQNQIPDLGSATIAWLWTLQRHP